MADLQDLMIYLVRNYPYPDLLSNARLTKLIYLCDWKNCLEVGHQMTTIEWFYDNYGPYVSDVLDTANSRTSIFRVDAMSTYYGSSKNVIRVLDSAPKPGLTEKEQKIAKRIISASASKNFTEFIRLVYSTYPVVRSERYTTLDLVKLASDYKAERKAAE